MQFNQKYILFLINVIYKRLKNYIFIRNINKNDYYLNNIRTKSEKNNLKLIRYKYDPNINLNLLK